MATDLPPFVIETPAPGGGVVLSVTCPDGRHYAYRVPAGNDHQQVRAETIERLVARYERPDLFGG